MSFVPLTGPATLHAAESPRDGIVEFTDDRRTITLPIRAALPVLAKARTADDAHPSVALLAAASLLGMRLVAAGRSNREIAEALVISPNTVLRHVSNILDKTGAANRAEAATYAARHDLLA